MRAVTGLGLAQKTAPQMTQVLRQAMEFLQADNAGLCGLLVAAAAENPCLKVELPELAEPEAEPAPAAPPAAGRGLPQWRAQAGGEGDLADQLAAPAPGLHAHVAAQLGLVTRGARERAIAEVLLEALEPSGWLGAPLPELARRAGCSLTEAEAVLARVQQVEPAGLFARSLAECLALQLADRGLLDTAMRRLIENLPLLARGEAAELARLCAVSPADLATMVTRLRRLDPKPGARFGDAPELRRAPDVIVSRDADGAWQVALNGGSMPKITLAPAAGARGQMAVAKWIDRTLSRRNHMVLEVAAHVVAQQPGFLERGAAALEPLTCAMVARALGYHDSTISRVRSGLLVQTPRGLVPMEAFFGRVGSRGEGKVPAAAVRALLAELVAAEPPGAPLSDRELVEELSRRGLEVSRRAVANHRALAGIPAAWDRRRRGGRKT